MDILHLTGTFGRLDHSELSLSPGLNVLYAPNETGKSTWGAFIRTMLYGLSTRERGPLADKNRYAPWTGAPMQGRMDLTTHGDACTLLRETRRAASPLGEFSCTYTGTGTPVPGITGQNAGEVLLGVPREVFERSAFIGQNALAVDQDAELERRIAALITTGEEDTSYTESYDRLKKQLNRRKHNKTGLIPALEREADQLRAALETQIAEYLPLRQQADEAAEAARRAEVSAADSEDACRRRLRDLLTQVRVFAPAAADLSGIQLALSDARRRKTALADARQTAREAALYRDALRVQLPEQPAAEGSIQRPALSREEAAAELARTQTLLAQERTRFDTLTGRIRALDRSSDLEAQLAQKQEQLTALQGEYDAIALAMDALSQANTVLQNRFSPALGARAAEIFSAITGGRYDRVLLSRDFSLSAEPAGDPVGRSVRLLSQGAADQLYLAVRLAICDMVLPADKRVPLILDDALVTFDDERLHAALDYLLEESQRRQILLFTCQKREMAYLQGKENVTVTKL